MGLYGNILVVPADPDYWPPAHRELLLTLDNLLIEDGKMNALLQQRAKQRTRPWADSGHVLLVGGATDRSLSVQRGEVVRPLYLTNTANTRVFNVCVARRTYEARRRRQRPL